MEIKSLGIRAQPEFLRTAPFPPPPRRDTFRVILSRKTLLPHAPLGLALQTLARAHRARLAALLAPHGVHAGQDLLLLAVWDEPGLRQAALATRLAVEPPTVTRMVQRLERSGLVERRRDPHDARVLRIHPTPRSRLLEGTVRRVWSDVDAMLVESLGESDGGRLRTLAEAATRILRKTD